MFNEIGGRESRSGVIIHHTAQTHVGKIHINQQIALNRCSVLNRLNSIGRISKMITDRWTEGKTDGRTIYIRTCRAASSRLKRPGSTVPLGGE